MAPHRRHLQTAAPTFDAAIWEIWSCLYAGSTVVIAPPEVRLSATGIVEYARNHRISVLFAPTAVAEMIVDLDADEEIAWDYLLTGGDVLRLHRIPRGWKLINHYGPAEATVCATWHPVLRLPKDGLPPIGRPIDGVDIALLGADGHPAAPGEAGEIHIGGRAPALGYHRAPVETERRFIPLPGRAGRWYRTGDLATRDAAGELHFLRRVDDDQVSIRGVRLETTEVEAVLLRHPRVRQVAVAPLGPPGTSRVLGAVVVADGPAPGPGELRQVLRGRLPDAAAPTRVVKAEALPLTQHRKIDRRAVQRLLGEDVNSR